VNNSNNLFSEKQLIFKELFVGTLIYAVVLGFFDDYTQIVHAKSFSTIFLSAFVLEVLTYIAFFIKKGIVSWLKLKSGAFYKFLMFFFVWLVMFLSKFIFVAVIDFIFNDYMNINGFFGILILVLTVTVVFRISDYLFISLGKSEK